MCDRDDGAWTIEVPDLPQVHTWVRNLRRASAQAAQAIAVWLGADPDEIDIEPTVA